MQYAMLIALMTVLTFWLSACSGDLEGEHNDMGKYTATLRYQVKGGSYALEHSFPADEVIKIVKAVKAVKALQEGDEVAEMAPDDDAHVLIIRYDGNVEYRCIFCVGDFFEIIHGENESSDPVIVDGLYDLIAKAMHDLEIRFVGTYPIDAEKENSDFRYEDIRVILNRVRDHLGLDPWRNTESRDMSYYDRVLNNLREFQEWYKANKDKIKWDENLNKYIVTE